ncbi:MAG: tetratricopeptide repeat protein [Bacteroidales bacterium]|nr:tetratricopeptide repeat protein [Bacteroidales bacterium]
MKKIITLIWILFCTCSAFGQQTVDYILKARAFTEAGKPDLAINILNEAISNAKESRLYIERAEANINLGDYSAAINDLNEADKLTPSSGEYGLSRIYALKGDAATSLYHLQASLNSPFRKAEKVIMLDPAFGSLENRPEWRQFWKKEWYSLTEKSISEIEYYIAAGKTEESKAVLSELKKSYQSNDDILYAEALINLSSGKYAEVVRIMSGLLTNEPENEKYLRILAEAQIGSSNPAGASETYTRLISSGVADARLYLLRAGCYKKTGETDKALADLSKYIEMYPGDRAALSLAGKIESSSGDNLKALEYFSENLKLHPNDPQCYIDRANSYFVSKSWNLAIRDYSMSLDLKPEDSDVWLNKGIALLNSGNVEDACHDFRKSLSQGNKRAVDYISRNCIK